MSRRRVDIDGERSALEANLASLPERRGAFARGAAWSIPANDLREAELHLEASVANDLREAELHLEASVANDRRTWRKRLRELRRLEDGRRAADFKRAAAARGEA